MGIEKLEPLVPRKDVDRRIHILRKEQIRNTAQRFRFQMIIQRYNTYQTHWQRICREMENGTYKRHVIRAQQRFGPGRSASVRPPPQGASVRTPPPPVLSRELAEELAELDREFAPAAALDDGDVELVEDAPKRRPSVPRPGPPRPGPPRAPPRLGTPRPAAPAAPAPPPSAAAPAGPAPASPGAARPAGSALAQGARRPHRAGCAATCRRKPASPSTAAGGRRPDPGRHGRPCRTVPPARSGGPPGRSGPGHLLAVRRRQAPAERVDGGHHLRRRGEKSARFQRPAPREAWSRGGLRGRGEGRQGHPQAGPQVTASALLEAQ
jgi:hypothetical protein